jgi:hypothetical protein
MVTFCVTPNFPSGSVLKIAVVCRNMAMTSTGLLIRMHERNNIKLHVQVFLRRNAWLFETCRGLVNWIKSWSGVQFVGCYYIYNAIIENWGPLMVAQWLRYCATNRKVAGFIRDGVIGIFHGNNPSDRTMALESTQPLTEMRTRSISWV